MRSLVRFTLWVAVLLSLNLATQSCPCLLLSAEIAFTVERSKPAAALSNKSTPRDIDGGQAEYVCVPYANITLSYAPKTIPEKILVLMGDVFPTGYYCASWFLSKMER
ncbi:hypothetical protein BFJ63_vAg5614 [Fusarium oxysporum f. sp. narcissi]|uniref:Uncharacterized protein n=1 Tax=Fusarium oxysporum f. sp. narcissi TaxID=451672 RepID=A0A4Q2VXS4_FUSOX|nr:hypothetical protein BFJ63_vAg5614 [Fusarium oxysporum f. sp. narcissi]